MTIAKTSWAESPTAYPAMVGGAATPRLRTCIEPMLALTPSIVEISEELCARWPAAHPATKTSAARAASSAHRAPRTADVAGLTAHTIAAHSRRLVSARGEQASTSRGPRVTAAAGPSGRQARRRLVIS